MPHDASLNEIDELIAETAEATAKALERRLLADKIEPTNFGPRLMTVKETCRYLDCSRATLRRLEEAGDLIPKRFGRRVRYERSAIDEYIDQSGHT